MSESKKLALCLLLLRYTVFLVMLMWTIDKFLRPHHAASVFENFYHITGLNNQIIYGIAIAESLLILAFVLGLFKTFTYGAVLMFNSISTFSCFAQYLDPYTNPNLLFFAAWPMLAACFTLSLLRDKDTMLAIGK